MDMCSPQPAVKPCQGLLLGRKRGQCVKQAPSHVLLLFTVLLVHASGLYAVGGLRVASQAALVVPLWP